MMPRRRSLLSAGPACTTAWQDTAPTATFETASNAKLKPEKTDNTLAFMFETHWLVRPIAFAKETPMRKRDYQYCWAGLEDRFYASGKQS
jgi:homogentisate 1,2-dioxygenase